MALSFTNPFNKKKNRVETQSENSNASSSSVIGGNGWLAFKEALKTLKDVASGPLAPVKIALVPVLACMEHAERVTGSHDEFQQLATKIDGFTNIFRCYKDRDLSSTMHGHLNQVSKEIEDIHVTIAAKIERRLPKRTLHAFKDMKEVKDLVDKLDQVLQRFKVYGDLELQVGVNALTTELNALTTNFNALATDNIYSKLRHVPSAGIDALNEDGCMDGTRVQLLKDIQEWCTNPTEPPIFLLDGMAGTGKSAISRSISRFLRDKNLLGGSFFCRRGDESRSDVNRILPTLGWFLARRDVRYRESLLKSLQSDPDLSGYSIERQVKLLLKEPLHHIQRPLEESERPPLVLVIDALDECSEGERVRQLIANLLSLPSNLPIKIFLTSRPEPHIRTQFESPSAKIHRIIRLHDIEKYIVNKDIAHYLQAELNRIRTSDFPQEWPTGQDIECLTVLTGKLFIYAFTAIKYINSDYPIERLEKLTGTGTASQLFYENLDEMYTLILSAATNPKKFEESEILETKRLLGAVLAIREPLCVSGLARLLNISPLKVRANLNRLHAVISIPPGNEEGAVSTFHVSFGDYLTTSGRAPANMLLSLGVGHRDLANGCLQTMNKELRFNITDCKTSHLPNSEQIHASISSLLKYCCLHWANHVVAATEIKSVLGMVERVLFSKFLFWLEVLSVMDASKMASISLLRILTAESLKDKMTSNLVQFFEDANEFVTVFRSAISSSAPHIYISAMPLVHEDSMISRKFASMFQNTAKFRLFGIEQRRKMILHLRGHTAAIHSVDFSPDGTRIVSGSSDRTIRVWDARTGEELMDPLKGHSSEVVSVKFSPDGTRIVSGSFDKTIRVWDAGTGKELMNPLNVQHISEVSSVGFSPDGTRIVSGSFDRTIRVWDGETGNVSMNPLEGHTSQVSSVSFSPDGTRIVSGSFDKTIRVWNTETGKESMAPLIGHTSGVVSVKFSLDGRIVSGSFDKTIRVWDVGTGKSLNLLFGHTSEVTSVSFSPDSTRIVSGSTDTTIRVWNATTGESMNRLTGHAAIVSSVSFSPDGTRIVSGSYDKTIRVWNATTGELMNSLTGHTSGVNSVSYSPDGTRIVSGSRRETIRVWNATTGKELMNPLNGHTSQVSSVGFSPDGTRIISGSYDKTIRVWDAQSLALDVATPSSNSIFDARRVSISSPDGWIRDLAGNLIINVWPEYVSSLVLHPCKILIGPHRIFVDPRQFVHGTSVYTPGPVVE